MSPICAHDLGATGVVGDLTSPVHRLDPRAKLLGFAGLTVVAVSTPLAAWPAFAACAIALVAVASLARVGPRVLWTRARLVVPLVIFVAAFLPFVRGGESIDLGPLEVSEAGLATFATVSVKAVLGTLSAVLLGATTSFPDLLHALERLRVPRLPVLVAAFMYRYLFVIADETRRMRAALTARAYRPRHLGHAGALGRLATALFLRSHARGERVYLAMLARGYAGSMPRIDALAMRRADVLFLAAFVLVLLPVRVLSA
jgi:cobalt/nickel transport system permease protein